MQDVKELVGIITRVLDNAEIAEAEVLELDFDAEGELLVALNEAYIKLLEFVHDRDLRRATAELDSKEREALQDSLNKIVRLCDADRPLSLQEPKRHSERRSPHCASLHAGYGARSFCQ